MYSTYCCVLLVWFGLYQSVSKERLMVQDFRKATVCMMAVSFCVAFTFSSTQGGADH